MNKNSRVKAPETFGQNEKKKVIETLEKIKLCFNNFILNVYIISPVYTSTYVCDCMYECDCVHVESRWQS